MVFGRLYIGACGALLLVASLYVAYRRKKLPKEFGGDLGLIAVLVFFGIALLITSFAIQDLGRKEKVPLSEIGRNS